eukprot:TRINITY_DN7278_c0_g1_i2.p1 TRINITY_DN7278_c0_g1~~TRINITY_DN7278_c0_g1_i2.p1  ORF type:complete len:185 (+),score=49.14 TRINITY_DN7278_c0_g1_i2:340-894(+)
MSCLCILDFRGFDETTETPAVVPVTTIRDLDDQEQTEEEVVEDLPETTGPISMNAFELINFAGAFDLSRMFRRLPPGHSGASQFTSFTSDKPAPVIISRLKEALDELSVKYVADEKSYKFKVTVGAEHGSITFAIHIVVLAVNVLHLVDFRRGKGEIVNFLKMYKQVTSKVPDLVPRRRGGAAT